MKLLLIGAITNSHAKYKDGIRMRFGGGVMYGGRAAAELGIDTTVVTVGAEDIEGGMKELRDLGLKVERIARKSSNNFSNDYTGNKRIMYMRSTIDKPIMSDEININPAEFDAVIFYPIYNEISEDVFSMFKPNKIMLDPQGFTRKLGEPNSERLRRVFPSDWENKEVLASLTGMLKISDEDLEKISFSKNEKSEEEKCQSLVNAGFKNIILTRGSNSTVIVSENFPLSYIDTEKIEVKDFAGAGDTFAVAFMFKFNETSDLTESTKFANKCAALKISGDLPGLKSI